jgi:hypothetical protein
LQQHRFFGDVFLPKRPDELQNFFNFPLFHNLSVF